MSNKGKERRNKPLKNMVSSEQKIREKNISAWSIFTLLSKIIRKQWVNEKMRIRIHFYPFNSLHQILEWRMSEEWNKKKKLWNGFVNPSGTGPAEAWQYISKNKSWSRHDVRSFLSNFMFIQGRQMSHSRKVPTRICRNWL